MVKKCNFFADETTYPGHILNEKGIRLPHRLIHGCRQGVAPALLQDGGEGLLWLPTPSHPRLRADRPAVDRHRQRLVRGEAATAGVDRGNGGQFRDSQELVSRPHPWLPVPSEPLQTASFEAQVYKMRFGAPTTPRLGRPPATTAPLNDEVAKDAPWASPWLQRIPTDAPLGPAPTSGRPGPTAGRRWRPRTRAAPCTPRCSLTEKKTTQYEEGEAKEHSFVPRRKAKSLQDITGAIGLD